jgi:hypothetical protein
VALAVNGLDTGSVQLKMELDVIDLVTKAKHNQARFAINVNLTGNYCFRWAVEKVNYGESSA